MMKKEQAITLIALIITIIILILLAVVTTKIFGLNIIGKTEDIIEESKIQEMKEQIEVSIAKKATSGKRGVWIEDLIKQLEKDGIITSGNSEPNNGQIKILPEEYIFEISKNEKGDWEVIYIGKGEIEWSDLIITATPNTIGLTSQVTINITAHSKDDITQYIDGAGNPKTYNSGTKQITETYVVTKNGTYTFTVKDSDGTTKTATVEITNIIGDEIQISGNPSTPTKGNVVVTVVWPSGSENGIKEIKVGEENWKKVTGESNEITVTENTTVKARIKNSMNEIKTSTLTIDNIDRNNPIVIATEGIEKIEEGTSNDLSKYFTTEANGTAPITKVEYLDVSYGNEIVTNTNTLAVGTHEITCIVTKATGATASAIKTVIVKKPFDGLTKTTKFTDSLGNDYVVPGGFKVRTDFATTVDKGIVIEDSDGNQFVWVPVGKVKKSDGSRVNIEFGRYSNFSLTASPAQYALSYTTTKVINSDFQEISTYRESLFSARMANSNATAKNLEKFITTTIDNGGYYIARYEASFGSGDKIRGVTNGATSAGTKAITNQKPSFKVSTTASSISNIGTVTSTPGMLWNCIRQGDASLACQNLYTGNEYNGKSYVESDLVNSYAWDTAIMFIQKCSDKTDYANQKDGNGTLHNTGDTSDVVCNIYDMAGNLREWTTEYSSDRTGYAYYSCVERGSYFIHSIETYNCTAARNHSCTATSSSGAYGFRAVLTCTPVSD